MKKFAWLALLTILYPAYTTAAADKTAEAIFAGGCFWCMEPPFDKLAGVQSTTSGYIGGKLKNPSYKQVSGGGTGHREAVRIVYDPDKVSYQQLLAVFWKNIDPLDAGGQFCDRGDEYLSSIFYLNRSQQDKAQASLEQLALTDIATDILPATTFYPAENYHQNYYIKNPRRYKFYRWNCGRDQRLKKLWN